MLSSSRRALGGRPGRLGPHGVLVTESSPSRRCRVLGLLLGLPSTVKLEPYSLPEQVQLRVSRSSQAWTGSLTIALPLLFKPCPTAPWRRAARTVLLGPARPAAPSASPDAAQGVGARINACLLLLLDCSRAGSGCWHVPSPEFAQKMCRAY